MSDRGRTRRGLLQALGTGAIALVAGCSGDGGTGGSSPSSTARDTPGPDQTSTTAASQRRRSPVPTSTDGSTPTSGAGAGSPTSETPTMIKDTATRTETPWVPGRESPEASYEDWRFDMGWTVDVEPTVHDGTVYAGSAGADPATPAGGSDSTRTLHALDAADGTERWRHATVHNVAAKPRVVDGMVLYVTGASGMMITDSWGVTALTTEGEERWRTETAPAEIRAVGDSTVLVGEHDGSYGTDAFPITSVTAVEVTSGRKQWHQVFGHLGTVEEHDGTTYVGTQYAGPTDTSLTAVTTKTGKTEWKQSGIELRAVTGNGLFGFRREGEEQASVIALDHDGSQRWTHDTSATTAFAAGDEHVYAATGKGIAAHDITDGTRAWTVPLTLTWDSVATVAGGTLYVGSGRELVAISSDGTIQWRSAVGAAQVQNVTPAGETVLAVPDQRRTLVAVRASDGKTRWQLDAGSRIYGPVVGTERGYVTTRHGDVIAVSLR